jgi:hypothetical protein
MLFEDILSKISHGEIPMFGIGNSFQKKINSYFFDSLFEISSRILTAFS